MSNGSWTRFEDQLLMFGDCFVATYNLLRPMHFSDKAVPVRSRHGDDRDDHQRGERDEGHGQQGRAPRAAGVRGLRHEDKHRDHRRIEEIVDKSNDRAKAEGDKTETEAELGRLRGAQTGCFHV